MKFDFWFYVAASAYLLNIVGWTTYFYIKGF
jgi:hypothetical protein